MTFQTGVITVNYNGWVDTIDLIKSFLKFSQRPVCLVIIDNKSNDKSVEMLNSFLSDSCQTEAKTIQFNELVKVSKYSLQSLPNNLELEVQLVENCVNSGFGAGNNLGVKILSQDSRIKYYWFLNNDIVFKSDHVELFENIASKNENKNLFLGSKLIYHSTPEKLQVVGGILNLTTMATSHLGTGLLVSNLSKTSYLSKKSDYPIGASLFFTKDLFERIGFFDESYFLYYEELDLVYRARGIGVGFKIIITSELFHKCGASINANSSEGELSRFSYYEITKSRLIFTRKHFPRKIIQSYVYSFAQRVILELRIIKRKCF